MSPPHELHFDSFYSLNCRAYRGIDGDSQQVLDLIVKRFGKDHLPTVRKINPKIFCIRLPNTHGDKQHAYVSIDSLIVIILIETRTH